jgi:23S rRNA (guanosine2251-2'-O)-methyltransferase
MKARGKSKRQGGRDRNKGRDRGPKRENSPVKEGTWVFGRHVVTEILTSKKNRVLSLLLLDRDKEKLDDIFRLAKRTGAKISWVPKNDLDVVSDHGAHQGMAAKIIEKTGVGLREFLAGLSDEDKKNMLLVALDQIQDPHNVGAIARSAACLGASAILFPERRSSPISQAVLSSSAGAVSKIGTYSVVNLAEALKRLKEAGFWIYGADGSGNKVWDVKMNRPMVLVIGSEGEGIRPLVRSQCDEMVSIPMSDSGVASMNASCAASVLLYEALRQSGRS